MARSTHNPENTAAFQRKKLEDFKKKVVDVVMNDDGYYDWSSESCTTKNDFLEAIGIDIDDYVQETTVTLKIKSTGNIPFNVFDWSEIVIDEAATFGEGVVRSVEQS